MATAIKTKTGDSTAIPASQFDTKIADIKTGNLSDEEYAEANDDLDNILQGSTPTKVYPPDWSEIGYEDTPQSIIDGFNYAKDIYDNWDSSDTDLRNKFNADTNLKYMPLVDTSNAIDLRYMFQNCSKMEFVPLLNLQNATNTSMMFYSCQLLKNIPQFNTSKVTTMNSMFSGCYALKNMPILDTSSINVASGMNTIFSSCSSLSNESLNNIMAMCIRAVNFPGVKTLQRIGLSSSQATTCQTLSNYQAFLDAGWTTGY